MDEAGGFWGRDYKHLYLGYNDDNLLSTYFSQTFRSFEYFRTIRSNVNTARSSMFLSLMRVLLSPALRNVRNHPTESFLPQPEAKMGRLQSVSGTVQLSQSP